MSFTTFRSKMIERLPDNITMKPTMRNSKYRVMLQKLPAIELIGVRKLPPSSSYMGDASFKAFRVRLCCKPVLLGVLTSMLKKEHIWTNKSRPIVAIRKISKPDCTDGKLYSYLLRQSRVIDSYPCSILAYVYSDLKNHEQKVLPTARDMHFVSQVARAPYLPP